MIRNCLLFALFSLSISPCLFSQEEKTITLDGRFGSFISLGESGEKVRSRDHDRIQKNAPDENHVASTYYFMGEGIRVRICSDNDQVGAINARVGPDTRQCRTDVGVQIGDSLDKVRKACGEQLQKYATVNEPIYFIESEDSGNLLTFGFDDEGRMTWVALGAPRENGFTCGR